MGGGDVRRAAVAGRFYTDDPAALAAEVRGYLAQAGPRRRAIAVVAPHAGYMYSGAVAGRVFGAVEVPERAIVLAVNHRGLGEPFASWARGSWETPLGPVPVDADLVARIAAHAPFLRHDPRAHLHEHSLEVELPFLVLARRSPPSIAPISIGSHDPARLVELGRAVAAAVRETAGDTLIVASTDMTHYEDAGSARRKDERALARIEAVDGPGLLATVLGEDISMCGVAPTAAALVAAAELGARRGERLAYANSGDVTGDRDSVVGYAGLAVA